jgi:lysophospholipase L1-like esterase
MNLMKKSTIAITCLLIMISLSFMPDKKIKVVFFGDSITQLGALPNGFIRIDDSLLNANGSANYDLIGAGISGNKVYDLYLRLEDDVISKSPDIVVIWIGVNDVWHKKMGTGTDADKFERFYLAIVKKLKAINAKIILCTPATIGEKNDYTNEQDGDLNKYSDIIRKIVTDQNLSLIDLHAAFQSYEKTSNPNNVDRGILTVDGVHLNPAGNLFVAKLMAEGIKRADAEPSNSPK